MQPSFLSRAQFADLLMDRILTAGETAPLAFHEHNFSIKVEWAENSDDFVDIQSLLFLDPWFTRYQHTDDEHEKAFIVNQYVDLWFSTRQQALSGQAASTERIIPLIRSRYSHEATKLQVSMETPTQAAEIENLLTYQIFAGHLAVSIAEPFSNSFRQLTRDDLGQLALSFEQALAIAKQNLLKRDPNFASGLHFEPVNNQIWCPAGKPHSNNAAAILFPKRIKRLPVKGQHILFVPHPDIFWVVDSTNSDSLRLVAELNLQEFRNCPSPLSALPYLLDGQTLKPWLPATSHPAHTAMKMLHIHDASYLYDTQNELLKHTNFAKDSDTHLSVYRPMEIIHDNGEVENHSICVWTDSLKTLLPKTDFVAIQQLFKQDTLNVRKNGQPIIGKNVIVQWETFASVLGDQLRRCEIYPERYRIESTLCPDIWSTLSNSEHPFADAFRNELQTSKPVPKITKAGSNSFGWTTGGLIGCFSLLVLLTLVIGPFIYFFLSVLTAFQPATINSSDFTPITSDTVESDTPATSDFSIAPDLFPREINSSARLPAFEKLDQATTELPVLEWNQEDLVKSHLGGSQRHNLYTDFAPEGGWLVGLRLTKGTNWGGAIRAVQPVYQVGDKYYLGSRHGREGGAEHQQFLAKPGYAISTIAVRAGLAMNAVQVQFCRVVGSKLDQQDTYGSEWYGCDGGNAYEPLSSGGHPIGGISGSFLDDHLGMRIHWVPATN